LAGTLGNLSIKSAMVRPSNWLKSTTAVAIDSKEREEKRSERSRSRSRRRRRRSRRKEEGERRNQVKKMGQRYHVPRQHSLQCAAVVAVSAAW